MRKIFICVLLLFVWVLPNQVLGQTSRAISLEEKVNEAIEIFSTVMTLDAVQLEAVKNTHFTLYQDIAEGRFFPKNATGGIKPHITRFNEMRKAALTTVLTSQQLQVLEKLQVQLNRMDFKTKM